MLKEEVRNYLVSLGMDAKATDEEARAFAGTHNVKIIETESTVLDQNAIRDLLLTAGKQNCVDEVSVMIRDNKPVSEIYAFMLDHKSKAVPVQTAELGMDKKEIRRFSFCKALLALREGNWNLAPFEKEVSDATSKLMRQAAKGICVPMDVLSFRDTAGQVVSTNTAGGNLVSTDLLSGSFIDLLKKKLTLRQLGMTVLTGLVGNIAIPRCTGGVSYYFVNEQDAATLSTATFDQVSMTPKSAAGKVVLSRQLLLQSSISVEAYVRTLLADALAEALEYGCLNGTGSNAQPLGLLKMSGLNSVAIDTNGGALTGDHIVQMETEVADDNVADDGTMAYLTNARVRGKLKRTQEFSSTNGVPVWKTMGQGVGDVNGYPAYVGGLIPKNGTKGTGTNLSTIVFGKWSDAVLALWGGLDMIADPYSGSDKGDTKIVAFEDFDFNVKHKESFCVCSDVTTV